MWRVAIAFGAVIIVGSVYETWALWVDERPGGEDRTITNLVRTHPHLAMILGGALFLLLGYTLGLGGA